MFVLSPDLDFSFLEMNPFTLVNGEPYPLDMRGELDDTAAFKNFKKYVYELFRHVIYVVLSLLCYTFFYNVFDHSVSRWGDVEFPLPFGRVLSPTESFIHSLDEKVRATYLCCATFDTCSFAAFKKLAS